MDVFYYQAYGLCICSDIKIPGLLNDENFTEPDVYIRQAQQEEFLSFTTEKHFVQGKQLQLFFSIPPLASFLIAEGKQIIYQFYEKAYFDELYLFLLGSCLGALLQQRGYLVLHGNAISIDKKNAVIFVGEQGAGKSTTTLGLITQGANILADDVCAIKFDENLQPLVIPSFPQMKIWQDTADFFAIDTKNLRRVRAQDAKYALSTRHNFCKEALPVKNIIELKKESTGDKIISGVEKLTKLIEHSYKFYFLQHQSAEFGYIKQLAQLAKIVSLQTMTRREMPEQTYQYALSKLVSAKSSLI